VTVLPEIHGQSGSELLLTGVAVEKLFSGNFNGEIPS
jgi:hypothetical protein